MSRRARTGNRQAPTAGPKGGTARAPRLHVQFLGTSAATPDLRSNTSAMLLACGTDRVLIDCGAHAVAQLKKAGIAPASLSMVAITHWHSDHASGIPSLVRALPSTRGAGHLGRAPLHIYGPQPPAAIGGVINLLVRQGRIQFHAVGPGGQIQMANGTLQAIPGDHTITSMGWKFHEAGPRPRHILFSGDTRPSSAILEAARGCDLLVHEGTFSTARSRWAHRIGHSTAGQAALVAHLAGAGALAITHISRKESATQILAEAREVYAGAILPSEFELLTVHPQSATVTRQPAAGGNFRHNWARITRRKIAGSRRPCAGRPEVAA